MVSLVRRVVILYMAVSLTLLLGSGSGMFIHDAAQQATTDMTAGIDRDSGDKKDMREPDNSQKAEYLYDRINSLFGIMGMHLYTEHYPPQDTDCGTAYLWPMTEMFTALNALGRLPGREDMYQEMLPDMIAGIELYRDTIRTPPAYQAFPRQFGDDERFYDDNV